MRIGAMVSGMELRLLKQLSDSNESATWHAFRLSTGKKINRPSDGPAAFVQIQGFEQRRSFVNDTLGQVNAASDLAAQSQLLVDQIRTQLDTVRTALLADEDQSLTESERDAKQATIDTALAQIDDLATTSVDGRRVLDGSTNYSTSGRDSSQVRDLIVYGTRETTIEGSVTSTGSQAQLSYSGISQGIRKDATFTLTGKNGSTTITVTESEALVDAVARINAESHKTRIVARIDPSDNNVMLLESVDYGSDANVDVSVTSGEFVVTGGNGDGTADGTDAVAVINGRTLTGDGNRFTYNQNGLHFELEFEDSFTGTFSTIQLDDATALKFALSPDVGRRSTLGLPGVQVAQFRGLSGSLDQLLTSGSLSGLGSNTSQAIRVVDEALGRLTKIEGRLDGFADVTVASSAALMSGFSDTLDDTLELINGVDETEEDLMVSRYQDLATNSLAALSVLEQQRSSILDLVKQIAGLS